MRGFVIRRVVVGAVLTVQAVSVAACGGDEQAQGKRDGAAERKTARPERDGGGSTPRLPPIWDEPGRFLIEVGKHVSRARGPADCGVVERVNRRSEYDFDCPVSADEVFSLRFRAVSDEQAYGSGAVVEYSKGDVPAATAVLNVTPDRKWAVARYGLDRESTIGTSDRDSRRGFDEAVTAYLDAVRERDCRAFAAVKVPQPREASCPTAFARLREIADGLDADPRAEPEYLGGNGAFGFYGLTLRRPTPRYWTISAVKDPPGVPAPYAVMDALPGPLPGD